MSVAIDLDSLHPVLREQCSTCPKVILQAARHGHDTCPECGERYWCNERPLSPAAAKWAAKVRQLKKKRRVLHEAGMPEITPQPETRSVYVADPEDRAPWSKLVKELLKYALASYRLEALTFGEASPSAMLHVLRGRNGKIWVGNGCKGTKPLANWNALLREPTEPPSPRTIERLDGLAGPLRGVAEAAMDAACCPELGVEHKVVAWPLAARLGLVLCKEKQLVRWGQLVLRGDTKPAQEGATQLGEEKLLELLDVWT